MAAGTGRGHRPGRQVSSADHRLCGPRLCRDSNEDLQTAKTAVCARFPGDGPVSTQKDEAGAERSSAVLMDFQAEE